MEEQSSFFPWSRRIIEKDLSDGSPYVYLGAWAKKKLLGFGVFLRKKKNAELVNLAVLPDYRRRGVASQILFGLSEIVLSLACEHMSLYVRKSNEGAVKFYQLFGFSLLWKERRYYSDGEDAFMMEARIPLRLPSEALSENEYRPIRQ